MRRVVKEVGWNLSVRRICEKHCEHGPIMACPFPGCPNGVDEDRIQCHRSIAGPITYRRIKLNNGRRNNAAYVWSKEEDPALILGLSRLVQRESVRLGVSPPPTAFGTTVYHYTSAAGVLGILDSKEVWLSDYRFLNDPSELDHGLDLTRKVFKAVELSRPKAKSILQHWGACDFTAHEVCIASFSYANDSLSQWRAYGPIAVGFDLLQYPDLGSFGTAQWGPVIYDPARQTKHLELLANLVASAWEIDFQFMPDRIESVYSDGAAHILNAAAFFKNAGFEDEREVRLVHTEPPGLYERMRMKPPKRRFRAAGELIVPYVGTIDIRDDPPEDIPERLPITEIIIGPGPNAIAIKNGIAMVLKAKGYDDVDIRLSQTPLRR